MPSHNNEKSQNEVFVCNIYSIDTKSLPVKKNFRIKTGKYGLWIICQSGSFTAFEKEQIAQSLGKYFSKAENKIK